MIVSYNNFEKTAYIIPYLRYIAYDNYDSYWELPEREIFDYEFILVTHGRGMFKICNNEHIMEPGDLLLIKPGLIHSGFSLSLPFRFICIHFDVYASRSSINPQFMPGPNVKKRADINPGIHIHKNLDFIKSTFDFPVLHKVKNSDIIRLFHKIQNEFSAKLPGWQKLCATYFNEMLVLLQREIISASSFYSETKSSKEIKHIAEIIQKNCYKEISVKALADEVHMNAEYFSRIFKKHVGMSPQKYIIYCRILHAKLLLSDKNNKVEWVARQCGFSSIHYFSRVFKKYEGMSPSQYQQTI